MKRWQGLQLRTMWLSMLVVGLAALVILLVRWGQERVHEPEHLPAHRLARPDLSVLNPSVAAKVDLVAVRDNAVFYSHRAFFQPPPTGQSIPAPEYDFAGSIGLPQGKKVAFLRKKSDKSNRTVHVGDDLDGWRVESIDTQSVVIEKENKTLELKAANESSGSGLVHGTVTPYVAESGLRTIGGGTAQAHPSQTVNHAARTYQPPPPRN